MKPCACLWHRKRRKSERNNEERALCTGKCIYRGRFIAVEAVACLSDMVRNKRVDRGPGRYHIAVFTGSVLVLSRVLT